MIGYILILDLKTTVHWLNDVSDISHNSFATSASVN